MGQHCHRSRMRAHRLITAQQAQRPGLGANVSFVRAMRVVGRDPFRSGLLEKSKDLHSRAHGEHKSASEPQKNKLISEHKGRGLDGKQPVPKRLEL